MRFYKSAAMTALQTTANLVAGIQGVERCERPSRVRLSGSQSLSTGGVLVRLAIAGRLVLDDAALGGQNRSPVFPDDVVGEWPARAGSLISLVLRESLGGTPTYFVQLDVDPVA